MSEWDLWTFPAEDAAGRAALKAVEPWLWAHIGHRLTDGALIEIPCRTWEETERLPDDLWPGLTHDMNCENKPNLYLHGPVGSGKTGLAWSLRKARLFFGHDADEDSCDMPTWVNVVQLLGRCSRLDDVREQIPIRRLYNAWLLVLDDLGAERPTDWARDEIAALVQYRHTRDRPTIVTSNYPPSQLAKRLGHDDPMIGARVVSRLTENCITLKLDRADLRARRAA